MNEFVHNKIKLSRRKKTKSKKIQVNWKEKGMQQKNTDEIWRIVMIVKIVVNVRVKEEIDNIAIVINKIMQNENKNKNKIIRW